MIDDAAGKVVVVTFDSDAPNTQRRGFVGTDDYVAGQVAADEVKAAVPDGGPVLIAVGSTEMSNGSDRRRGLIDGLVDRPFNRDSKADPVAGEIKGKKYSVVATVTDAANADAAEKAVADALKAHPAVTCVVGLFSINGPRRRQGHRGRRQDRADQGRRLRRIAGRAGRGAERRGLFVGAAEPIPLRLRDRSRAQRTDPRRQAERPDRHHA